MRDLSRMRSDNAIWLSRTQFGALAVTAGMVAVLTFFIGLTLGKQGGEPVEQVEEPEAVAVRLIPAEVEQDGLTELLARVEQGAIAGATQGTLSYPERLVADEVVVAIPEPELEPEPEEPVHVEEPVAPAPSPPELSETPPSGWAVQLHSFDDAAKADARVAELRDQDVPAFRVDALLGGQTRYRVRVGPFGSEDAAREAATELRGVAGGATPRVTLQP